MNIRHSTEQDFDRMMEIYSFAREYMAEHGNPNQWGPTNCPPEALIRSDIRDGNSYVCLNATCLAVTASLAASGQCETIPACPEQDERGLYMRLTVPKKKLE